MRGSKTITFALAFLLALLLQEIQLILTRGFMMDKSKAQQLSVNNLLSYAPTQITANLMSLTKPSSSEPDKNSFSYWKDLKKSYPASVPIYLMYRKFKLGTKEQVACHRFPMPWDISGVNENCWQFSALYRSNIFLYSAYHDPRPPRGGAIRILGMIDRKRPPNYGLLCLFFYEGRTPPRSSNVTDIAATSLSPRSNEEVNPYLITCPLNGHEPPNAVSIVFAPALGASAEPKEEELEKGGGAVPEDAYCPEPAAPTNLLFVPPFPSVGKKKKSIEGIPQREERLNFAVCVKGISFLDPSMAPRLAEWIELLSILGADKIFFHYTHLHWTIFKVLKFYETMGIVNAKYFAWGGPYSNNALYRDSLRRNTKLMIKQDNIPYNDCFYRNLGRFRYVSILDIDEVIMPLKHSNWGDMMADLEKISHPQTAYYSFANTYFMYESPNKKNLSGIPEYMRMTRTTIRSSAHLDRLPKSMMKVPGRIKTTIGHRPSACLPHQAAAAGSPGAECRQVWVSPAVAHLAHYRSGCQMRIEKTTLCREMLTKRTEDVAIWRFKEELIKRVANALANIPNVSVKKPLK